jgi:hypothetical protein
MKFFPYKKKNLGKTELQFIIATMIESAISQIDSIVDDVKGGYIKDPHEHIRIAQETLGENLSIFYAQTNPSGDGMGVCDALDIADLGDKVEEYGKEFFKVLTRKKIETLVEDWYKEVFGKN